MVLIFMKVENVTLINSWFVQDVLTPTRMVGTWMLRRKFWLIAVIKILNHRAEIKRDGFRGGTKRIQNFIRPILAR